jgi:hypothetical protein
MPTAEKIPFELWLDLIFDHPADATAPWPFQLDANVEPVPPATFVQYGARLFRESPAWLSRYSDAQVVQGLNVMTNNSFSSNVFALQNNSIPINHRRAFIDAIFDLNRDYFEPRCTPHLSHLDRQFTPPEVSPLNMICYMWWDTFVAPGGELNDACLAVMENSLQLSNPAVLEGALHGLGHWQRSYPHRCEQIINTFLKDRSKQLSPQLRAYAMAAATGCIL